ncbi:hypothetical protein LX15_005803 [Streptoalloteichus tenebrarius]|uniref:ABC-2 type transport system permease protein n=1 Tax=Streptoalloteichus tenebrarius (strain ATCC 17920 / DSM 40477 / JCM 4838 / CBS 697.72 / NBRC 16177 / NCIMB 11028 / NRRL B-12390 / A12253. 1 / ISP 5477) TaxID=1933 RepID=A0ABT1I2Q9_STRSD|nr:DUF6297 family protein [Streptoalloteichus tenebrarius]MCP2262071.1 hypothetical protein [Streptoalloteichus tenebrarius]BFF01290.1 hypothetical protein GCM10020241_29650 [Streptoalloteichus tenebrarius]
MTGTTAPAAPSAREFRQWVRTARQAAHPAKRFVGVLTEVVPYVVIVGGLVVQSVRRLVELAGAEPPVSDVTAGAWMLLAAMVLLVTAGVRALGALGPVSAGRPTLTWILSTPVDRRRLLAPRFWAGAAGSAVVGAAAFTTAALVGRLSLMLVTWSAALGGLVAVAAFAAMVVLEAGGRAEPLSRRISAVFAAGAVLLAAMPVLSSALGWRLAAPPVEVVLFVAAPVFLVVAVVGVVLAHRALGRLDRGVLGAGGDVAMTAVTSVAWLDLSLLTGTLEFRRWRRMATVRPRRGRGRGLWVLLWSEARRVGRMPGAVAMWAAMAVVPYAGTLVVSPAWAHPVQIVAGGLAVARLTAGLRAVNSRPGLRRMMPLGDRVFRLVHCVVPAVAALVWAGVTTPAVASATGAGWAAALLVLVASAATALAGAVRTATKPPLVYDVPSVSTPLGDLPLGLFQQLLRGPDVVVGLALLALAGLPPVVLAVLAVGAAVACVLTRSK